MPKRACLKVNFLKKLFQTFGIAFFILMSVQAFPSNKNFQESERIRSAYRSLTALDLDKAYAEIEVGKRLEPDNKLYVLLENYLDFFKIFTLEDESYFHYAKTKKDQRLAQISNANENSPYYLYAKAEINIQWAFSRLRFREYWTAAWELRRAYRMLEKNIQLYPDFQPNLKSHSLIRVLAGSIPERYHWIIGVFGISPDLQGGISQLENLVHSEKENFLFYEESLLIYCMLLAVIEVRPVDALKVLTDKNYPSGNRTLTYFTSIHIAVLNRKNQKATQWINELKEYYDFDNFPYLHYLDGLHELQKLNTAASVKKFNRFLETHKGRNQLKSAYQKIAWSAWVDSDTSGYLSNMELVKSEGHSDTDSDIQALSEATSGMFPHQQLLKVRLLTDGGYLKEALEVFENIFPQSLRSKKDRIEFNYRKARIFHFAGNIPFAKRYYEITINKGMDEEIYFAPNAALQLGLIYEKENDFKNAAFYFSLCLESPDHEYKKGLDQRAKAGLQRVK